VARAIAPALGGLVVAAIGPFAVFLLNAATFIYVILVLARWRPTQAKTSLPPERLLRAVRRGLRFVRHSPELLASFFRTGVALFAGSCLLALLPIFARRELSLDSAGFGLLYGCMGVGAVISAALLPKLRMERSLDKALAAGTIGFAVVLLLFAFARSAWLAAGAMLAGGVALVFLLSRSNLAV